MDSIGPDLNTCPARAGLIRRHQSRSAGHGNLSRTRGVDPAAGSHALGSRDHLRVCGAVMGVMVLTTLALGLSPRVRSGLSTLVNSSESRRIISACAEQTPCAAGGACTSQDHLRVCGADHTSRVRTTVVVGSPPRVRSRQWCALLPGRLPGITSACAEQTTTPHAGKSDTRDHLRVCGADSCILLCSEPAEWRGIFDLRTA